jgi:ArsR family transcriptional regulator, arsenate/arsenite/antimonite-responsive transcriptional repressor / arsenate reductase (thioredoxin)
MVPVTVERSADEDLARRVEVHHALADPHRLRVVDELRLSDRTPGELLDLLGVSSSLLAFHLDVLEDAGIVTRQRSRGDGRRRYVRLLPEALAVAAAGGRLVADTVLFACTHNAARSQLAAALWTARTGRRALSAGTDPAPAVHPLAVEAARVRGLDLGEARPLGYGALATTPDLVVSVCDLAHEARPPFDVPLLHWSLPDPVATGDPAAFEAVADELAIRVDHLAQELAA